MTYLKSHHSLLRSGAFYPFTPSFHSFFNRFSWDGLKNKVWDPFLQAKFFPFLLFRRKTGL